jgi:alkylhydroperoxidase family enzyme
LCEYAEKLTRAPAEMGPEDVARLRDAGFDDEGISSATQVIAYFNYINRIAEGLGVPMEEWLNADGTPRNVE